MDASRQSIIRSAFTPLLSVEERDHFTEGHASELSPCAEIGTVARPDARGWRDLLTVCGEDAEDIEEIAVFCPERAELEFGDS